MDASFGTAADAKASVVDEIAEQLAALQLGPQGTRRLAVIVPLKPTAQNEVRGLLEKGLPFDPATIAGLDRHEVFLAADQVVFLVETHLGPDELAPLVADPRLWEVAASWREHVAGPPALAEEVFSWSRSDGEDGMSYLATPGPGDSDGGDIF